MKDTKQFFDKYAYDFDAIYGVPKNPLNYIINPIFRKSMRLRYEKSMSYAYPIKGKTVLDIGCGPGHYAIALCKAGAKKVVGVDFSDEMINIAQQKAQHEKVDKQCEFIIADVFEFNIETKFNYTILMGFMDYIADPVELIEKVISLTQEKILLSFPIDAGLLSFQRKLRYQKRCPLYMYKENDLKDLFSKYDNLNHSIEKISRDFFVTLSLKS